MKVVMVHNHYVNRGGEDEVFDREILNLRSHGHEVVPVTEQASPPKTPGQALRLAVGTIWSLQWQREMGRLLREIQPDIVHVHNFFPNFSPSIFHACHEAGVPVVLSLHNPRLLCPSANFYRDGRLCEDCLGKTPPWPGIVYGCYHRSRAQTTVVASMLTAHRLLGTWLKHVDGFIVFREFFRKIFVNNGVPEDKILIKPHFVTHDPGFRGSAAGEYALFIGRLSPEKGIHTVLKAWSRINNAIPLKIVGDGPLRSEMEQWIADNNLKSVEIIKPQSVHTVSDLIKNARFLIWPSEGYETFGLVVIEAFACGVPVIASSIGVTAETVEEGRTGLLFEPGNPHDLASRVEWAWAHPDTLRSMGEEARKEYELYYTPERNYRMHIEIYTTVINRVKRDRAQEK